MATKSIGWIIRFTCELKDEIEQIKCLQANDNNAIRTILKYAFDPNVKWLLPEGDTPYQPCKFEHQENNLYSEVRRLYLFLEGGNTNLKQAKREFMFVDLLQNIDPEDAKLLNAVKDKKLHVDGLKPETVLRAFPGLW